MTRKLIALSAALLLTLTSPFSAMADNDDHVLCFEHLSIGTLDKADHDGYRYHCIYSDLYYIEYPGSFVFGSAMEAGQAFYHPDDQVVTSDNSFKTFQDEQLRGTVDSIEALIRAGGINGYLKEVLNTEITSAYTYRVDMKDNDSGILMIYLEKDGETVASIIVWTMLGQTSIRSEIRTAYRNPQTDHGEILLNPVWDDVDFSSVEAITAYIQASTSESFPCNNLAAYQSSHHQFMRFESETADRKLCFYIPVVPEGNQKWILLFSVSKDSQVETNVYNTQENIINTFQALK